MLVEDEKENRTWLWAFAKIRTYNSSHHI